MGNHYHRYHFIESKSQPPDPTIFWDAKGDVIEIGSRVLFYMQGAIREGQIMDIQFKWKKRYYSPEHWDCDFKIFVELTEQHQNDYKIGHVSTLKSFDIIWRVN